jgi:hypothetical protein
MHHSRHNSYIRGHKFDKNSHVIMKGLNFATDLEKVTRIFLFFLFLLFSVPASFGLPPGAKTESNRINDFSPFQENGKFGLKNTQGHVLIPAQYDRLGWSDGSFSVIENVTGYFVNGAWGLINLANQKVTKAEYTDLSPGQSSLIVARKTLPNTVTIKTGCISTSGKTVIPFSYDGLRISSLRAIVYQKSGLQFRHGLIDLENKVLIPLQYAIIYPLGTLRYAAVSFNNKTAIFSEDGKQLTDFSIDSISTFKKNYAVIFQGQQQGVINRAGEIVLKPVYREINISDEGAVSIRMADQWSILQGDNKTITQCHADSVMAVMPNLFKIKSGRIIILADKNLKPINNLEFTELGKFSKDKAKFRDENGKAGLVRSNGAVVVNPQYDQILPEKDFIRATVRSGGSTRWVLLDSTGKNITKKNYEFIDVFNGKFFPVKNKGFFGAMDVKGNEIVSCVHDSIIQSRDEFIVVKFKGQYGIINTKEDWLVTPKPYRLALAGNDTYIEYTPSNRFLRSFKNGLIYFTSNHLVVKNGYLEEHVAAGGIIRVGLNGVVIERLSDTEGIQKVFSESEGYRAIKKDGRYGFIDNRSRLRIANRYEDVKDFSEGLAAAKILGKWGFINKEDRIAVQPVYEDVSFFKNGVAIVRQKGLYGLIDKNGKLILPVRYEHLEILSTKRIKIIQNGLAGIADTNGQILINPKFNHVEDVGNDYVIVGRDEKFGVVTTQGVSTIPMMYDSIDYDPFQKQFIVLQKSNWETTKL